MSDIKLELLEVKVDIREPDDTLQKVLKICPLAKRDKVDVGDIVYKNVAIELKSWSDFVLAFTSKKDDRFRRQLYNFLINKDIEGYYIIYGDWSEINAFSQIKMTAVLGAIASIQARYGMRLCILPNKDYAIYVSLKIIEKTYDHKDVRPVTYRVGSDERAIDGIVAIGERVGSEDGIRLLEHFGNFKNVVNATEKQMVEVHKIGKTKAKNLLKVIEYDFKSKAEFEENISKEFEIIDIDGDKVIEEEKPKKVPKKSNGNDSEKLKDTIFKAITIYTKKKNESCPMANLLRAIKHKKRDILQALHDLELESKIYQSDKDMWDVY